MRIEKIRIENLNSLYGVHEIDLTDAAYKDSNLFLLWGDTGSGKTTVLDAITLALYGQTSRLKKINENENEIMSKGRSCCSAEVTFSLDDKRYRAKWSQTRTVGQRGANKGVEKLSKYQCEFCILDDQGVGTPLGGTTNTSVQDAILKVIKLSYDQFNKAVLLEQGKFSVFMNAKDEERAIILEQLTGTEIYNTLGEMAFKRMGEEKIKYDDICNRVDSIKLLEPEELIALEKTQDTILADIASLNNRLEWLNGCIQWMDDIQNAQKRVHDIELEQAEHQKQCAAFEPQLHILEYAQRAGKIVPLYDNLNQARSDLDIQKKELDDLLLKRPKAEQEAAASREAMESCSSALQKAKQSYDDAKPRFDKVREMQTKLRSCQENWQRISSKHKQIQSDYASKEKEYRDAAEKVAWLQQRLEDASVYFSEHAMDENLIGEFEAIKGCNENLDHGLREIADAQELSRKAEIANHRAQQECTQAHEKLQSKTTAHQALQEKARSAKAAYDASSRAHNPDDLRARMEDLRKLKSSAEVIANYESKRRELKDGDPCPLCGSTHHPYCLGQIPEVSQYDRTIRELENMLKSIEQAQKAMQDAVESERISEIELTRLQQAVQTLDKAYEMAHNAAEEKNEALQNAQERFADHLQKFNAMVEKYGETATDKSSADAVCTRLAKRLTNWNNAEKGRKRFDLEFTQNKEKAAGYEASFHALAQQLQDCSVELDGAAEQVSVKQREIEALFGSRSVDAEEKALKDAEESAELQFRRSSETYREAERMLAMLKTGIEERQKGLQAREDALKSAQNAFVKGLQTQQFQDESSFLRARLPADQLNLLIDEAQTNERRKNELQSRFCEVCEALDAIKQRKPLPAPNQSTGEEPLQSGADEASDTFPSLDALQTERTEKTAQLKMLHEKFGANRQILDTNQRDTLRSKEMQVAVRSAEAEFRRWEALSNLLGHGTKRNYRKFAQGITFNILLNKANTYLRDKKLMARYELVRRNSEDLSLDFVVQDYQTGRMRPVSNLSGGEQFCLSLALALALSEMASKNVSIDSLFIDEGLGTLDDNTLDSALMMLKNLSTGKRDRLVGLITHVSRARELVTTQILAEKLGSGRSRLTGPGCSNKSSTDAGTSSQSAPKTRKKKSDK